MALKRNLNKDECFGFTQEEIERAEKYLRRHKTAGAVPDAQSLKLYESFMIGCSFVEIHNQYPQYPIDQVILTAALNKWPHDRERMLSSLKDRVQSRVVKSVLEQVDFLTTLLSVVNTEHLEEMKAYIRDPDNNRRPEIRVQSIKDYKEVAETLAKLVAGSSGAGNRSAMFDALSPERAQSFMPKNQQKAKKNKDEEDVIDIHEIAALED